MWNKANYSVNELVLSSDYSLMPVESRLLLSDTMTLQKCFDFCAINYNTYAVLGRE